MFESKIITKKWHRNRWTADVEINGKTLTLKMLQYTQIKEIFPMLLGQEISLNGKTR